MTVDVEDYFQVEAFAERIPRASWDNIPRRIEANIEWLLQLFAIHNACATFFVLGWIAERHPEMIRRIAAAGHELASHGYDHTRVDQLTAPSFREDVRRSKGLLEHIANQKVLGYRAPTFSIGSKDRWAYEILEDEGYRYSSSVYPIRHDLYGDHNASRTPFRPGSGALWEFPLATRRLLGQNFPSAGGGYFRLLPYRLSRWNIYRVNVADRIPCIFYCHPWEVDPSQPRVRGAGARTAFRHYVNLRAMPGRLSRLVADLQWGRMDEVFGHLIPLAAPLPVPVSGEEPSCRL